MLLEWAISKLDSGHDVYSVHAIAPGALMFLVNRNGSGFASTLGQHSCNLSGEKMEVEHFLYSVSVTHASNMGGQCSGRFR